MLRKSKHNKLREGAHSPADKPLLVQTRPPGDLSLYSTFGYSIADETAISLYRAIRESIPIVDAALCKIARLIGGFRFRCKSRVAEEVLNRFAQTVQVGSSSRGLEHFICAYLDSLLTFGNAVGEIVLDDEGKVAGLYNADISDVVLLPGDDPLSMQVCGRDLSGQPIPPPHPERILFTAFNPPPGKVRGQGILHSVPFVSSVLMKVYSAIGLNFDRIGNIRFAVTYKPGNSDVDRAYAKERAEQIAREWSQGMAASRNGDIHDFVTVGDVDIKVIGADNQILDCNVPAKQMLEQIVAKLSIPPFMLGLSWSTTERMSQQQADMLSNELAYYRRLLDPVIMKIAVAVLRTEGFADMPDIEWDVLNFSDEILAAQTRLYNAQAQKIELECGQEPEPVLVDISAQPDSPAPVPC